MQSVSNEEVYNLWTVQRSCGVSTTRPNQRMPRLQLCTTCENQLLQLFNRTRGEGDSRGGFNIRGKRDFSNCQGAFNISGKGDSSNIPGTGNIRHEGGFRNSQGGINIGQEGDSQGGSVSRSRANYSSCFISGAEEKQETGTVIKETQRIFHMINAS